MDTLDVKPKRDNDENLAAEIAGTVDKLTDDIVRCTRVNGSYYRCNWWTVASAANFDNPTMKTGQIGTTHRIRKSQFLCVTKSAEGLSIGVVGEAD